MQVHNHYFIIVVFLRFRTVRLSVRLVGAAGRAELIAETLGISSILGGGGIVTSGYFHRWAVLSTFIRSDLGQLLNEVCYEAQWRLS